jgi:hypothetical protein
VLAVHTLQEQARLAAESAAAAAETVAAAAAAAGAAASDGSVASRGRAAGSAESKETEEGTAVMAALMIQVHSLSDHLCVTADFQVGSIIYTLLCEVYNTQPTAYSI